MFRLTFTIHPDDEDDLVAQLSEHDLAGISQFNRDDGQLDLIAWFTTRAAAELAHAIDTVSNTTPAPDDNRGVHAPAHRSAGVQAAIEEIPDQNWNAPWQATWQPSEVGQKWYLTPPNHPAETPAHRIRLELKPGLAFGNGDHPTTHLCLEAMEDLIEEATTFLDVGCGSGLLSEAARYLGAQAFGCDLNARDLPPNAFQGSLNAVKSQSIDTGAMNIQAGILAHLWPDFTRVVKHHAILSGYLPEQSATVEALIQPPWRIVETKEKGGWCALVATTRSADPAPPPSKSS